MTEAEQRASSSSPAGGGLRIVIADDHEPTRVLLRTLVEVEAMHVVGEAEDGKAAVALAFEQRPDAVLLDVNMPRLDGISAAVIIRAQLPEIRLFLHTGELLDTVRDRAAEHHLLLADKRDLAKTIEQLAEETDARGAAAASEKPAARGERTVDCGRPAGLASHGVLGRHSR